MNQVLKWVGVFGGDVLAAITGAWIAEKEVHGTTAATPVDPLRQLRADELKRRIERFERGVVGKSIAYVNAQRAAGGSRTTSAIEKVLAEANAAGGVYQTPLGEVRLENDIARWLLEQVDKEAKGGAQFTELLRLDAVCERNPKAFWAEFELWFHNPVEQHVKLAMVKAVSGLGEWGKGMRRIRKRIQRRTP